MHAFVISGNEYSASNSRCPVGAIPRLKFRLSVVCPFARRMSQRSALSLSSSPPGSPAGRGSPPPSNAPTTLPPSPNGRAFSPLSPPPKSTSGHSPLLLSAAKRDDAHPLSPSAVNHAASHPLSPSSASSTVHAPHPSRLHVLVSDAPIFPANVNLSVFSPTGEMSPTRNKFLDKHLTPPRSPSARTGSPSTFPSISFILFLCA